MEQPVIIIYPPDKPTMIKGLQMVAKANVIMRHNRINSIKVMDCPDRGLVLWTPSSVRLSMECREMITDAVREKGLAP
ncbi:hypothetical protein T7987_15890 [Sulfitobacter faviae]|uniref:Uncharacterized protein n=1 Tax=Sulfitobacter faviae TaxID=1775881 RepID=A0ABZ0UYY0_9RHOB|nr:hypothetical protein [Sulfitobacter faviae]WPZ21624.1 hypothetical protein T7987_15890 [Sulfitobacter faviae]